MNVKKENEKASHKLEEGICNSYSELHPEYIKNFCELIRKINAIEKWAKNFFTEEEAQVIPRYMK